MSTLSMERLVIPSASLGRENPLPDLKANQDAHANINVDAQTISPEESQYMGWGRVNGILPYTILDNYSREKKPRAWKAAVLENDCLRATFLPELGGRLWSLFDKDEGRELLFENPALRIANLAIRNAWFSGGVEWNLGHTGHHVFTCADLFGQARLLDAACHWLNCLARGAWEKGCHGLLAVGAPVRADNQLFNCLVLLHGGVPVAIVPKSCLPNYGEFYEKRWFAPASARLSDSVLWPLVEQLPAPE